MGFIVAFMIFCFDFFNVYWNVAFVMLPVLSFNYVDSCVCVWNFSKEVKLVPLWQQLRIFYFLFAFYLDDW